MEDKSMVSKLARDFQKTIEEDYGRKISKEEAGTILKDLVGYFDLLAKIYHKSKVDINNQNKKEK